MWNFPIQVIRSWLMSRLKLRYWKHISSKQNSIFWYKIEIAYHSEHASEIVYIKIDYSKYYLSSRKNIILLHQTYYARGSILSRLTQVSPNFRLIVRTNDFSTWIPGFWLKTDWPGFLHVKMIVFWRTFFFLVLYFTRHLNY